MLRKIASLTIFRLRCDFSQCFVRLIITEVQSELSDDFLSLAISRSSLSHVNQFTFLVFITLVPEVFLDFSSRKRSRANREAATTSRESDEEREKNFWLLGLESHFHADDRVRI